MCFFKKYLKTCFKQKKLLKTNEIVCCVCDRVKNTEIIVLYISPIMISNLELFSDEQQLPWNPSEQRSLKTYIFNSQHEFFI